MGKKSRAKRDRKTKKEAEKPPRTGNAFIDAIHDAQEAEKQPFSEVRVVTHEGYMALKPVAPPKSPGKPGPKQKGR